MKASQTGGSIQEGTIPPAAKTHAVFGLAAIALAALLIPATVLAGPPNYTVTTIGMLSKHKESVPAAVNASGQVAGTSSAGASFSSAFLYDGSKKIPMEELAVKHQGAITRAFALNGAGLVVGDATFENERVRRAAIFGPETMLDLGTLKGAGPYSRATGVNALEQVVGFAGPAMDHSASRAFIWSASTGMQDIGTLGGPFAQALAINDAGFVTGFAQTPKSELGEGHAFLHRPYSEYAWRMVDLGTLGGSSSYGTAINDQNHVVGYSSIDGLGNEILHAFLHDGNKMVDLGSLDSSSPKVDHSVALGINNADEVVGYSYVSSKVVGEGPIGQPQQVAFIYRDGKMMNLNEQIGRATRKYLLLSAVSINEKGQIAAVAYHYEDASYQAVLLTPVTATR